MHSVKLSATDFAFGYRHIKGLAQSGGQVFDERNLEHLRGMDWQSDDFLASLGEEFPLHLFLGKESRLF